MISIDGAQGEGGGQVLRTALTLAVCTGRAVHLRNVRAGRRKPGLLRQHLAALRAAQAISGADVEGMELGAREVRFEPHGLYAGAYHFAIGSAGSTTLVLQTVLPALALAAEASTVTLEGGTHNAMAPSVDFIEQAFLPLLEGLGLRVQSTLLRHGFYPNGGGLWRITVQPWRMPQPLKLVERGGLVSRQAVAKLGNLKRHIAERELERVAKKLRWPADSLAVDEVEAPGPGNVLSLRCRYRAVTEVFDAVGALGVTAEQVAGRAIRALKAYERTTAPVGVQLADQLLLPMVLGAGGEFVTGPLSCHTTTNAQVLAQVCERRLVQFEPLAAENGVERTRVRIPEPLALAR